MIFPYEYGKHDQDTDDAKVQDADKAGCQQRSTTSVHPGKAPEHVVTVGDDDSSDSDSITGEAKAGTDKQNKRIPANGWMKTRIKQSRNALAKKKKEEREATQAATQAEQEAKKANRMKAKVLTNMMMAKRMSVKMTKAKKGATEQGIQKEENETSAL